jgi:predicted AAA+ superfamily ATPase
MSPVFERPFVAELLQRLQGQPRLIQVLTGPRQVGKTTGVRQLMAQCGWPAHYASADDVLTSDRSWLLQQWQQALLLGNDALLVIDEIQKVPNWSETLKALWDQQPARLRVLLLGSSALQIHTGVSESLAGRFELLRVHHWTFAQLQAAFGYDLPRYLAFGGYPGAVALEGSPDRWYAYMKDAIVEAVIGKDILQSRTVAKPALFRQAFEILCAYPAQEISYTKLLGQLQDGGNTDLIRHYIELYGAAFLLHALQKYSAKTWLSRSSSPKMLPACPALYSLVAGVSVATDAEQRGRAFELAVGAELMQQPGQLFYWRERNDEVDFVLQYPDRLYAIEVKSGRKKSGRGLEAFCRQAPQALRVIVTPDNFAHFSQDPRAFMAQVGI